MGAREFSKVSLATPLLLLALLLSGCQSITGIDMHNPARRLAEPPVMFRVFDIARNGEVYRPDFIRRLAEQRDYDLLILGEVHDNPDHHLIQTYLVTMLNKMRRRFPLQPTPLWGGVQGIAFEMIPESREDEMTALRPWRPGLPHPGEDVRALAEMRRAIDWDSSGWPDWSWYSQIILAAPQAYIAGGAIEREKLMQMAKDGAATAPDAMKYALDQPLPMAEQAAREAEMIASHCNRIPPSAAPAMVAAQRIRDARFAEALLRAEQKGNGFSVLITGNSHARKDWGAPRALRTAAPEKRVLSIALMEVAPGAPIGPAALGAEFGGRPPFDYVIVTSPPASRSDPCRNFPMK